MNVKDQKELERLQEIRYYIIEHRTVIKMLRKHKLSCEYQQKTQMQLKKLKSYLGKVNRMIKAINDNNQPRE